MNLSHSRHPRSVARDSEVPIDLPNVVITVDADGTLTATVDGLPVLKSPAEVWTRATFGPLMDAITKDRTIAVRVEVRECDGTVFTDIIRARKSNPPEPETMPEAVSETRRGRRSLTPRAHRLVEVEADGFVPGEDVGVAVIVSHTDATGTGHVRALVDLDELPPRATGETILFGRISGTTVVRRLQ